MEDKEDQDILRSSIRDEERNMMMANLILITGGARSGKSSFALELALRKYANRTFIATALASDGEMKERILRHRRDRGDAFLTVEEPIRLAEAISSTARPGEVAVVDCLTVWLGNLYHHLREDEVMVRARIEGFLKALDQASSDLILVTNEVGWGIVPENPMARSYRDMLGFLNHRIAEKAEHVYLLCCGIPLTLKGDPTYGS